MAQPQRTCWQQWLQHPQGLWFRKALFQVHLWVGVGIAIYVLAISVSGSAIVYQRELMRHSRRAMVLTESGRRMSVDELTAYVQRAYPAYEVDYILEASQADRPDDVVLERGNKRIERLFDPNSGADLGDPEPGINHAMAWITDLHDNLLAGQTGRLVNGAGACLVTLLGLTGMVMWWPGVKNWRRSATINWHAQFPRFNWDVHSAAGFWFSLFVLVWGISGIYFCAPMAFTPLAGGSFLYWLTQFHIGRFGWFTEAVWTAVGLVPAVLAVTGVLMWWNRVLRKKWRKKFRAERYIRNPLRSPNAELM